MAEGSEQLFIGEDSLANFNNWLADKKEDFSSIFFLVDSNTLEYCLPRFAAELSELESFEILEMSPGESNKSWDIASQLLLALTELGADRKSLLISLGGGVVTDMGGFIASVFKRGINSVLVPTSLLAMTDASIGGKTAVDLENVKNLAGTFSMPSAIVVWQEFLSTLSLEHYSDGLAETFKHALLADKVLLGELMSDSEILTNEQIERSLQIKKHIVNNDPLENGGRKVLNLGHTVGHALESYKLTTDDPWLHGRCVAAGILVALELSQLHFSLNRELLYRMANLFHQKYALSSLSNIEFALLEPWLIHDKKNENGELRFVLLQDIGKPVFDIPLTSGEVQNAWKTVFSNG